MSKGSETEPGRTRITAQFEDEMVDEINAFRHAQKVPPSQSEVVRFLIRAGLRALRGERLQA